MAQEVQGRARICDRLPKKWTAKNSKDRYKCGQSTNLVALISIISYYFNAHYIAVIYIILITTF
jgi:hypothetical protein